MAKATDPTVLQGEALDQAATPAPFERLAAHLGDLQLDAESLEIIMAALTAEVCDQIEVSDT